jgi:hypothetical protein
MFYFTLFRFVSFRFVSVKMTISRNIKFREIKKLVSLPFSENFVKRNFAGNPALTLQTFLISELLLCFNFVLFFHFFTFLILLFILFTLRCLLNYFLFLLFCTEVNCYVEQYTCSFLFI